MDAKNPFETPTTYRAHRAEYLVGFVASTALLVWHYDEVRWLPAIALFLYIDLIGYIPGAIAFHRSETKRISKVYYYLYNAMHSLITQAVVVTAWGLLVGWEWALLVIPFHVFGDRGVFGNFLKPLSLPFEPVAYPGYSRMIDALRGGAESSGSAIGALPVGAPARAGEARGAAPGVGATR